MRRSRRGNRGSPQTDDADTSCSHRPCQASGDQSRDWVQCDECNSWSHSICAGLPIENASLYNYSCPNCRRKDTKRINCPGCSMSIVVQKNGSLRVHGPVGSRCPYSNKSPSEEREHSATATDPHSFTSQDFIKAVRAFQCKTVKYVPKAARFLFAQTLNKVLRDILNDPDNKMAWVQLFTAAYRCLKAPARAGCAKKTNLTTLIKRQIDAFSVADTLIIPEPAHRSPSAGKNTDAEKLARLVCEKINEGNIKAAVRIASSDKSVVPPSDKSVKILEKKHPPPALDRQSFPQCHQYEPLQVTSSAVHSAIQSFPNGSAGGPSGVRPQHIKDALSSHSIDAGNTFLDTLTDFVNLILAGKAPDFIRPVFAAANLTTLAKKGKVDDLRPIAVGEVWRRIAGKCAGQYETARFKEFFSPFQLGSGAKNGVEVAVHAARSFFELASDDDVFLKLDFSNAFNTMRRDSIAFAFEEFCPELLPFFNMCYERESFLVYGDHTLLSREGFQQGDPIASFGFCLGVHRCLTAISSKFKVGYMDDISAGDKWQIVLRDFAKFIDSAKGLRLNLNNTKCEITVFTQDQQKSDMILREFRRVCPGISSVSTEDAELLGSPLGHTALQHALEEKREKIENLCKNLPLLPSHVAFFLLRHCFAIPKLMYLFRTAPTFVFMNSVEIITSYIRGAVQTVSNILITNREWDQLTLPIKLGGLGLQSPSDLTLAAYISSTLATSEDVSKVIASQYTSKSFKNAIELWFETVSPDMPLEDKQKWQKSW